MRKYEVFPSLALNSYKNLIKGDELWLQSVNLATIILGSLIF